MTLQIKLIILGIILALIAGTGLYIHSLRSDVAAAEARADREAARADQNVEAYLALAALAQTQNSRIQAQHDAFVGKQVALKQAQKVASQIEADAGQRIGAINQVVADFAGGDQCAAVFKLIDGAGNE